MIGFIQGKILDTDGKKALVLASNGIGYEINYWYYLEEKKEVGLYIHHHVSENDESLWGFNTLEDKKMFELLKTVNKVGSSKAYPLISVIGTERVMRAILFEEASVLIEAPGIGKKMAEQIILSLRDKVEKISKNKKVVDINNASEIEVVDTPDSSGTAMGAFNEQTYSEVLMVLDSLGYKDKTLATLVRKAIKAGESSSQEIIKTVLREI